MKPTYLIIAILLGGLAFVYFTKDSGTSQLIKEKDRAFKKTLDSLQLKIDSIQKEKIAWMEFVSRSEQSAQKWENESRIWKSKYEKQKKHKTGIVSDRSYDSLINGLYPR